MLRSTTKLIFVLLRKLVTPYSSASCIIPFRWDQSIFLCFFKLPNREAKQQTAFDHQMKLSRGLRGLVFVVRGPVLLLFSGAPEVSEVFVLG